MAYNICCCFFFSFNILPKNQLVSGLYAKTLSIAAYLHLHLEKFSYFCFK